MENSGENIGLLTLLPADLLTATGCNAAAHANYRILTKLYHILLDSLLIVDIIDRLNKLGLSRPRQFRVKSADCSNPTHAPVPHRVTIDLPGSGAIGRVTINPFGRV